MHSFHWWVVYSWAGGGGPAGRPPRVSGRKIESGEGEGKKRDTWVQEEKISLLSGRTGE